MAKSKKTKKVAEALEPIGEIKLTQPEKLEHCEWCFQFDEDAPQIFAWTSEDMKNDEEPKVIFTVSNTKDSYITFTHKNGKSFKLFARQLSEAGIELRNQQIQSTKNQLQNESTNKEA